MVFEEADISITTIRERSFIFNFSSQYYVQDLPQTKSNSSLFDNYNLRMNSFYYLLIYSNFYVLHNYLVSNHNLVYVKNTLNVDILSIKSI